MASNTILFFGDLLHHSNSAVTVTASGTASGYHINHVRDTNLLTSWKDADSATADFWIKIDGGSTGWLGAAGDTAYIAFAYDARTNEQDSLNFEIDTADNSGFTSPSTFTTATLTKGGSRIQCVWLSFTIPTPAKRYYRIVGAGTARTEAAGDNVTKFYAVSMFDKDTVFALGTSPYAADAPGSHELTPIDRTGVARSLVGSIATNKFAADGMRFQTTFQPATVTLWEGIRDQLAAQGGKNRANWVQHEGLKNDDDADFFLARMIGDFQGQKSYIDLIESGIPWETEPWL